MTIPHYLEHLSDSDVRLLASVWGTGDGDDLLSLLHSQPAALHEILSHPAVWDRLRGGSGGEALLRASPFLVFAVLVSRAAIDLRETHFVQEWIGPGRRVPMFDVSGLRDFSGEPERRLFLAELLASYTHVASGSFLIRTPHGWRRRRFSELDPVRLLELLESLSGTQRIAVYRRLGDLALFLTGVFPDYAGDRLLPRLGRRRLQRTISSGQDEESVWPSGMAEDRGDLELLEAVGRHAYRAVWRATEGRSPALADIADRFALARRVLNFVTDRYLFPFRQQWFPTP